MTCSCTEDREKQEKYGQTKTRSQPRWEKKPQCDQRTGYKPALFFTFIPDSHSSYTNKRFM